MPDKGGPFPTVWSCRRSSASTSTSRTSAGGSPSSATSRSPPRCTPARATSSGLNDFPEISQDRPEGARRAGDVRPRRGRGLRQGDRQGRHREARRSPASAGAGGSSGSTRRTTPASRPAVAWYGRLKGQAELQPKYPGRPRRRRQGPRARPLWRGRPGHPGRDRRGDARGPQGRRQDRPRSRSIPTRPTPSTPTTARATARSRPRTAGSGCSSGSRRTAWRNGPSASSIVHLPRA